MALYAASSARIFLKSCHVFVNYAHFSKIRKIYTFTFYFKFGKKYLNTSMQQTSKWQKHLPYLYVGTLRVHYYIYSLKTIKI